MEETTQHHEVYKWNDWRRCREKAVSMKESRRMRFEETRREGRIRWSCVRGNSRGLCSKSASSSSFSLGRDVFVDRVPEVAHKPFCGTRWNDEVDPRASSPGVVVEQATANEASVPLAVVGSVKKLHKGNVAR